MERTIAERNNQYRGRGAKASGGEKREEGDCASKPSWMDFVGSSFYGGWCLAHGLSLTELIRAFTLLLRDIAREMPIHPQSVSEPAWSQD